MARTQETCGSLRVSLSNATPDSPPGKGQAMTQDDSPDRPATPVLDRVHVPADMKDLSDRELHQLADELRAETISAAITVAPNGFETEASWNTVSASTARSVPTSRRP